MRGTSALTGVVCKLQRGVAQNSSTPDAQTGDNVHKADLAYSLHGDTPVDATKAAPLEATRVLLSVYRVQGVTASLGRIFSSLSAAQKASGILNEKASALATT